MKILHLIPKIVPSPNGVIVGGSVNALLALVKAVGFNCESIIYTHTDKGLKTLFSRLHTQGPKFYVEENTMPSGSLWYGIVYLIRGLITMLHQIAWRADLIHGHSGFVPYSLLTVLAGKILKKPCIYSIYCPVKGSGFIKSKLYYCSLVFNDQILVMSENIKDSLLKIGIPERKIEVLPPFFDLERFKPDCRSHEVRISIGAKCDEPVILFVGNLKPSKGLDLLVDALGIVAQEYNFEFVYALELKDKGFNEKLKKIFERITNNGLSGRTKRLGIIDSMPALMASSDLIVVPYRDTDGPSDYPIVLMEAMSSGIPAVATKAGGIPELIEDGETGLLCEPEDIVGLAHCIKELMNNAPLRKELGNRAREKAIEIFKKRNLGQVVNKIYSDVLEKRGVTLG